MADDSLGSAYLRILPDTTGLNAQLAAYFQGPKFSKFGKVAGGAIAAGLAAGGIAKIAYDIGEQFDDAFDKIRVQTGATGKDLGKLEKNFKSVLKGVPTDFDSASTAVAGLNQRLGLTGKPLVRLSKQMTELSRITETDLGSNIQSVTRLFGDWSIKTGKQSQTLDKLFRASQATGIQVSDLADSMVQFGSPLRQLGLDFDTSAAMFARFEKEGVNVTTLMPGLRMALKNFSAPTDELAKTFERLGVNLKDPSIALQDIFAELEKAPSNLKANALAFEVFGARAGPDMAAAVREGRFELDELIKVMSKGDTIRQAGKDTMDFNESWTLLKNNFLVAVEPAATAVFQTVGKGMAMLVKAIPDIRRFFRSLGESETLRDLRESFTALGRGLKNAWEDVILPILRTMGPGMLDVLRGIGRQLKGAIDVIAGILTLDFGRAFGGVKDILGGFIDRIVGVFKGAAALVAAPVKALAKGLTAPLTAAFHGLQKAVVFAFDKILGAVSSVLGIAGDIAGELDGIPILGDQFDGLADAAHGAQKDIDKFRESIRGDREERSKAKALGHVEDAFKALGRVAGVNEKDLRDWQKDTARTFGVVERDGKGLEKKMRGFFGGIGKGIGSLDDATYKGLDNIGGNLGEMLRKLKQPKITFSLKKADKAIGKAIDIAGGAQVGGILSGYSRTDDRLIAVRGGEAILRPEDHVPTVDASLRMTHGIGLADYLKRTGGKVGSQGFATGGLVGLQSGIARLAKYANERLGLQVSSGLRSGPAGASWHNTGEAVDLVPPSMGATKSIFGAFKSQLEELFYDPWGGYDSGQMIGAIGDHTDHIHAAILGGGSSVGASKVARWLLEGPDGPMKTGGQAALDKARAAANAFLRKQSSHGNIGAGGGALSESEFLALANQAIGITDRSGIWGGSEGFSASGLLTLAKAESSLIPSSINNWDSNAAAGNPSGGLMHLTQSNMAKYAEPSLTSDMFDALSSIAASINYQIDTYGGQVTHSPYRLGGIVGFAGGGMLPPELPGGGYNPFSGAGLIEQIQKLYAKLGKVGSDKRERNIQREIDKLSRELAKKQKSQRKAKLDVIDRQGAMKGAREKIAKGQTGVNALTDYITGLEFNHGLTTPREVEEILAGLQGVKADAELWELTPDQRLALETAIAHDYGIEEAELQEEANWNQALLSSLVDLRAQMLVGIEEAERRVKQAERQIQEAERKKKKAEREARDIERRMDKLQRDLEKLRKEDAPERRKHEKPKDYEARLDAWRKRKASSIDLLGDKLSKQRFALGQARGLANYFGQIAGAARTNKGEIGDFVTETLGDLEGVQGIGRSMDPKLVLPPLSGGVPVLGGQILGVQVRLAELGMEKITRPTLDFTAPVEEPDTPEAVSPLRIDELLRFAEAVKYGGLPTFHTGGWVVPPAGKQEMDATLKRGEYVLRPDVAAAAAQGAQGGDGAVMYADIYIGGEKIDERVEVKLRDRDRASNDRQRAGIR